MDAIRAAEISAQFPSTTNGQPRWIRLRHVDIQRVPETRQALKILRQHGLRTCVMLRYNAPNWKESYLPHDLRGIHEDYRQLGAAFGDLVDAWEIDNEPDIGFVPEPAERFAAYLKAVYLGLKKGFASNQALHSAVSGSSTSAPLAIKHDSETPLIVMAALGLPPGPWLQQFAMNDGFTYSDGYNYHYYGYADDFTDVYRVHETAVQELTTSQSGSRLRSRSYPVFLTEIGYGMLGRGTRDTKEGRLRQWRWFQSVGRQTDALGITGPFGFYLPPYLEYERNEYGLTVPAGDKQSEGVSPGAWKAGQLVYRADDLLQTKPEAWTDWIGHEIAGNALTPAGAWWLAASDDISRQTSERFWSITTPEPTPIVLDFLPGPGMVTSKRYNGHLAVGLAPPQPLEAQPASSPVAPSAAKSAPPPAPVPRQELVSFNIRTQNGNLYYVYPARPATSNWQQYMEPSDNYTMAFYGRAALPWQFSRNTPVSLLFVMYPAVLPATYEFKYLEIWHMGNKPNAQSQTQAKPELRYAQASITLYNFSEQTISGRLQLPSYMHATLSPEGAESSGQSPGPINSQLILKPGERREVPVLITVAHGRYERLAAEIVFVPEKTSPSSSSESKKTTSAALARLHTDILPDIGGMKVSSQTALLSLSDAAYAANAEFIRTRYRAVEEAPMQERTISLAGSESHSSLFPVFVQSGAEVAGTPDGFTVTVRSLPPGKEQRIEVEIPWPAGMAFPSDSFLYLEYRLHDE